MQKKRLTKTEYQKLLATLRQRLDKTSLLLIADLVYYCNWLESERSRLTTELNQVQNINLIEQNVVTMHDQKSARDKLFEEKKIAILKSLKGKEHEANFTPIIRSLGLRVDEAKKIMETL